jgi:hypothetical protein
VLTFMRLVMVPIMLILWELEWRYSPITAAIVFIAAALTDWLDGFLARQVCETNGLHVSSSLGLLACSTHAAELYQQQSCPRSQDVAKGVSARGGAVEHMCHVRS